MLSHYLVHWDGYQSNLQAACERQFLSESFVDVTLAVEAGLIKCHRVVLSAASSYFHQLLAQHTNCPHPVIFMRDMEYWEVIALVDFMYRGEVSVPADKLEQLMRAAHTLQIHGLSSCLKAYLGRSQQQEEVGEDSQGSMESGGGELPEGLEPHVELSTINKLCELNSELELRPISPMDMACSKAPTTPQLGEAVPTFQRNVVKEEIEFIEDRSNLSPVEMEPEIQIQSVYTEHLEEKAEISDEYPDIEVDPLPSHAPPTERPPQQFLLVSPIKAQPSTAQSLSSHDTQTYMYKRYSPRSLEQALRDLNSGRFRSIRACARHHGIPMTTLRYRAKVLPKRPAWLNQRINPRDQDSVSSQMTNSSDLRIGCVTSDHDAIQ